MSDEAKTKLERELDATVATAQAVVGEAERLASAAQAGRRAFAEWKAANGITEDVPERFTAKLSPEARQQYEAEKERLAVEDAHDQEAALQRARPTPPASGAKARRSRNLA